MLTMLSGHFLLWDLEWLSGFRFLHTSCMTFGNSHVMCVTNGFALQKDNFSFPLSCLSCVFKINEEEDDDATFELH